MMPSGADKRNQLNPSLTGLWTSVDRICKNSVYHKIWTAWPTEDFFWFVLPAGPAVLLPSNLDDILISFTETHKVFKSLAFKSCSFIRWTEQKHSSTHTETRWLLLYHFHYNESWGSLPHEGHNQILKLCPYLLSSPWPNSFKDLVVEKSRCSQWLKKRPQCVSAMASLHNQSFISTSRQRGM